MNMTVVNRMIKVCLWADVVPELQGHKGIGKTDIVQQIGNRWKDPFTTKKGLPVIPLYLATQEITDLLGFPLKVWEISGVPVIQGVESPDGPNDRIVMSWAEPSWWPQVDPKVDEEDRIRLEQMKKDGASKDELHAFWNRPQRIIFLDEIKRAQKDVIQAMFPLVLSKRLHVRVLPRGSRIVTADNFAGAYDVLEPDEAFMSRFCHIDVTADIRSWHKWAIDNNIDPKVVSFLTSNPMFLNTVAKDVEDAAITYKPLPDPRSWELVDRVIKFGHYGMPDEPPGIQQSTIHKVITGITGLAAASAFQAFSSTTVSFHEILKGKKRFSEVLEQCENNIEQNKLVEKMLIESSVEMENRPFSANEAENLVQLLVDLKQKDRAVAILQTLYTMKNNNKLDGQWTKILTKDKRIASVVDYLKKQLYNHIIEDEGTKTKKKGS